MNRIAGSEARDDERVNRAVIASTADPSRLGKNPEIS
jgi:hypothetical protein